MLYIYLYFTNNYQRPLGLQFLNPNKAGEMAQIMEALQSKYVLLSALRTVNRMLSLLGLTTIGFRLLFIPRYFIKRSRMSLLAVAVSPSTGVPFFTSDRNSRTRPKASRNAAFPFFPIPLWKTKKKKFFLMKLTAWAVRSVQLYGKGEMSSWSILLTDTRITQGQCYQLNIFYVTDH